jgi:hypothetical protein
MSTSLKHYHYTILCNFMGNLVNYNIVVTYYRVYRKNFQYVCRIWRSNIHGYEGLFLLRYNSM